MANTNAENVPKGTGLIMYEVFDNRLYIFFISSTFPFKNISLPVNNFHNKHFLLADMAS